MHPAGLRVLPGGLGLAVGAVGLLRMAVSLEDGAADADTFFWYVELAAALTAALLGCWIVWQSPSSASGWLLQLASIALALSAMTATAGTTEDSWLPFGDATVSVQLWANLLGRAVLLAAAIVSVPDRLVSGRTGGGVGTAVVAAVVVAVTAGLLVHNHAETLLETPFGFGNRAWIEAAAGVPPWVFAVLIVVHAATLVGLSRQRGGEPTLFQIIGWGIAACALPAAFPSMADRLPVGWTEVLAAVALPTLPVVSVVAALRALSWTVSRFVSRSIVWGVLSLGVITVQSVAVVVAAAVGSRAGFIVAGVLTVAVAAGFQAARRTLQRTVDRLLYGAGRDPWVALGDLGRRMEAAIGPEEVLPDLAVSISEAFGTAVRLELMTASGMKEVARAGTADPGGTVHAWPLVHQSERIGTLTVIAPDRAALRRSDLAALGHLARQAAVTAYAVRASLELRRSQSKLVAAVEDERRRLQRELHDGLGPRLAGVALGIRAARNRWAGGEDAQDLLCRLTDEVETSVEEVRRIVHDLRPAVLDQLGLVAAVRAYGDRCSQDQLVVTVEVENLPRLSAATEVAAYRIAVEAITNVVRHAHARSCRVRLRGNGDGLTVEIEDDGVGFPCELRAGVGLASMRERSASLGGRLLVDVAGGGGARIVADLPGEARLA